MASTPKSAHSKDLIAASATPLVLSILKQSDSYGYAIIRKVHELSKGEMEWSDGMLYPILHRLEKRELIESYWGQGETGRKRKYYKLRQEGSRALDQQRQAFENVYRLLTQMKGAPSCPA